MMKNIPIVILNKNRLEPLKLLVDSLRSRNYENIIVIDNKSTYEPLLEWYGQAKLNVFTNDVVRDENGSFYLLAVEAKHPTFAPLLNDYYVFTDSDVVPVEDAPDDYIEAMVEVSKEFPHIRKVGPNIKIDDFVPGSKNEAVALYYEKRHWVDIIPHPKYELYRAAIDTGFAVYAPNSVPLWADNCIRMGGKYIARHMPFYYDNDNLPEDELYYITHLEANRGPVVSMTVKQYLQQQGKLNNV